MNKCQGCGALLQTIDREKEGYTININNSLCERCFRIRHYNDYQTILKDNQEYVDILSKIESNSLVILVVDIFSIPNNLDEIGKILNNPILLVVTKRDLLPKSLYEDKLINYFNKYKLNILDTVLISSKNNYNFDYLYEKIYQYKTNNIVYVVGYTNAGKSSMINKIISNYTDTNIEITTSMLPSTTLNSITIKINDELTLIDTPGLLEKGNITNIISGEELKKITPTKVIKPITYQIKTPQIFIIDNYLRIDCNNENNIIFFISNKLEIERYYKDKEKLKDLKKYRIKVNSHQDIVISGLGFIKVMDEDEFTIYTYDNVDIYCRESLI